MSDMTKERIAAIKHGETASLEEFEALCDLAQEALRARERRFPLLLGRERAECIAVGCPASVSWSVIAPHETQAQCNHDQSLEELAERGGLGVAEMVCVLEGRPYRDVRGLSEVEAVPRLLAALGRKP